MTEVVSLPLVGRVETSRFETFCQCFQLLESFVILFWPGFGPPRYGRENICPYRYMAPCGTVKGVQVADRAGPPNREHAHALLPSWGTLMNLPFDIREHLARIDRELAEHGRRRRAGPAPWGLP